MRSQQGINKKKEGKTAGTPDLPRKLCANTQAAAANNNNDRKIVAGVPVRARKMGATAATAQLG